MDFLRDLNRKLDEYFSPAVKTIFLINVFVFLAINILDSIKGGFGRVILYYFAQIPRLTFLNIPPHIWSILTYAFVHVSGMHILFNMATLWMFGTQIENKWGTRYFWTFYLGTAAGAGLINAAIGLIGIPWLGYPMTPTIGASGALNAIFFAYACYFPNHTIFFFGIIPMPAKYLMALLIAFDVLFLGSGDNISHTVHLAGLLIGFLMLTARYRDPDVRTWRWRE